MTTQAKQIHDLRLQAATSTQETTRVARMLNDANLEIGALNRTLSTVKEQNLQFVQDVARAMMRIEDYRGKLEILVSQAVEYEQAVAARDSRMDVLEGALQAKVAELEITLKYNSTIKQELVEEKMNVADLSAEIEELNSQDLGPEEVL